MELHVLGLQELRVLSAVTCQRLEEARERLSPIPSSKDCRLLIL